MRNTISKPTARIPNFLLNIILLFILILPYKNANNYLAISLDFLINFIYIMTHNGSAITVEHFDKLELIYRVTKKAFSTL